MRADLRKQLRVNNERLGQALTALKVDGSLRRTTDGWKLVSPPTSSTDPRSAFSDTPVARGTERRNAGSQLIE